MTFANLLKHRLCFLGLFEVNYHGETLENFSKSSWVDSPVPELASSRKLSLMGLLIRLLIIIVTYLSVTRYLVMLTQEPKSIGILKAFDSSLEPSSIR